MAGKRKATPSKRPGLALLSALDRDSGFPGPRQQFVEPVDRISVDHALEHVLQICIRFDAVELAGLDQRTEHSPSTAAAVAAAKR